MSMKHEKRNAGVRRKLREYFDRCDAEGKKYTYPGLRVALGATEKTLEAWRRDKSLGPDIELALAKIRDGLEQREDQMALYLRRQEGAKEEKEEKAEGTIRVYFETPEDGGEYGG